MNKDRFDKAFKKFIRSGEEKITPLTFFQILATIEQERVKKTIELKARIIEGKLHFEPSPDISVKNNETVLGNQRIIVNMS
ncbi:MAG: hypothetical protein JSW07_21860 [bacterium]|nr:MAG: hypothetical protein JSW07_21860 [bacterium]